MTVVAERPLQRAAARREIEYQRDHIAWLERQATQCVNLGWAKTRRYGSELTWPEEFTSQIPAARRKIEALTAIAGGPE